MSYVSFCEARTTPVTRGPRPGPGRTCRRAWPGGGPGSSPSQCGTAVRDSGRRRSGGSATAPGPVHLSAAATCLPLCPVCFLWPVRFLSASCDPSASCNLSASCLLPIICLLPVSSCVLSASCNLSASRNLPASCLLLCPVCFPVPLVRYRARWFLLSQQPSLVLGLSHAGSAQFGCSRRPGAG